MKKYFSTLLALIALIQMPEIGARVQKIDFRIVGDIPEGYRDATFDYYIVNIPEEVLQAVHNNADALLFIASERTFPAINPQIKAWTINTGKIRINPDKAIVYIPDRNLGRKIKNAANEGSLLIERRGGQHTYLVMRYVGEGLNIGPWSTFEIPAGRSTRYAIRTPKSTLNLELTSKNGSYLARPIHYLSPTFLILGEQ